MNLLTAIKSITFLRRKFLILFICIVNVLIQIYFKYHFPVLITDRYEYLSFPYIQGCSYV